MKTNTKTKLETLVLPTTLSLLTLASFASININSSPAHAESSSASANASVTVSDSIRLTLTGGDLVINNLTPGTSADSNNITATVTSNSPYGYHLSATTGTSSGTTSLVNTADSNFSFTNLSTNKATLNDFSDNTWGYSYSTNNGISWISGDYGTALAGYNGLTLDNDDSGATGTTLFNNDSYAGSTAVKFKIGAKSSQTQASGTYTGTVNFYAVTNPGPDNTMQGFAAGNASTTCTVMSTGDTLKLKDSRDNTEYTIGKLADGKCWLLDNLALDLTNQDVQDNLTVDTTNASNLSLSYLKGEAVRDATADPNGNYPTAKVATDWSTYDSSKPYILTTEKGTIPQGEDPMADAALAGGWKSGIYYDFCAASGGSYCYNNYAEIGSDVTGASEDICPAGWRLPTGGTSGELNALVLAITGSSGSISDSNKIRAFRNALRFPCSGSVSGGRVATAGSSLSLWTSTRDGVEIKDLRGSTTSINPALDGMPRYNGETVRCILKQQPLQLY